MNNAFIRSKAVFGDDGQLKLNNSHVAIFGLGGVGSYAVEALVRAGVGEFTLIDNDVYSTSNLNRQLYATVNTIGALKTETAKNRILEINPLAKVNVINKFILEGDDSIDFTKFSYVIDAIDTVSGKMHIIKKCKSLGVSVISCMSAGNKLDATKFMVADLFKTKACPLCKVMRKLCKDAGIVELKVVYSEEEPIKINDESFLNNELKGNRPAPCSVSFVPPVMGLIAGGEVIKDIVGIL